MLGFFYTLIILLFIDSYALAQSSCSSFLNQIETNALNIITTRRDHVVIDQRRELVYKVVGSLQEAEDLKFANWLFEKLNSKTHKAVKPIAIIQVTDFALYETSGFPLDFIEIVNDYTSSHVVIYPYIKGTEFLKTDLRKLSQQDVKKVQEIARLYWAEIERMFNLVRSESFTYRGFPVKATLLSDKLLFGSKLSTDRMLDVNGPGKMVEFYIGDGISDRIGITLNFGENKIYTEDGVIFLIDPY